MAEITLLAWYVLFFWKTFCRRSRHLTNVAWHVRRHLFAVNFSFMYMSCLHRLSTDTAHGLMYSPSYILSMYQRKQNPGKLVHSTLCPQF